MKKLILLILIIFFSQTVTLAYEETLILLDSSASMLEEFNGKSKYIMAIEEVKNVLEIFPNDKPIGIRIIGISMQNVFNFLSDSDNFCTATSIISPIKENNITNLKNSLDTIFPLGTTPLTYALEQAINNDFNPNSFKHIILITDGGESCGKDPCSYIRETIKYRNDIKIDIIGIDVTGKELEQLNCISNSTNGITNNINSSDDFSVSLSNILKPIDSQNVTPKYIPDYIDEIQDYNEKIIYKNYLLEE